MRATTAPRALKPCNGRDIAPHPFRPPRRTRKGWVTQKHGAGADLTKVRIWRRAVAGPGVFFMCTREAVGYTVAMPLNVEIEKLPDGVAVVTMTGQLTLGLNLKLADSQVHAAIAEGATKLVFDLTGLDYIDSAGLGMVVFTYGTLNEKGGTLRLCGVASRIASVLKLTKTDELLGMDGTREESLAALGVKSQE
jgi:anti-sigma B factor antagonist